MTPNVCPQLVSHGFYNAISMSLIWKPLRDVFSQINRAECESGFSSSPSFDQVQQPNTDNLSVPTARERKSPPQTQMYSLLPRLKKKKISMSHNIYYGMQAAQLA